MKRAKTKKKAMKAITYILSHLIQSRSPRHSKARLNRALAIVESFNFAAMGREANNLK